MTVLLLDTKQTVVYNLKLYAVDASSMKVMSYIVTSTQKKLKFSTRVGTIAIDKKY